MPSKSKRSKDTVSSLLKQIKVVNRSINKHWKKAKKSIPKKTLSKRKGPLRVYRSMSKSNRSISIKLRKKWNHLAGRLHKLRKSKSLNKKSRKRKSTSRKRKSVSKKRRSVSKKRNINKKSPVNKYTKSAIKLRSNRPSPSSSATEHAIGTKKRGNDGNIWKIIRSGSSKRWSKVK